MESNRGRFSRPDLAQLPIHLKKVASRRRIQGVIKRRIGQRRNANQQIGGRVYGWTAPLTDGAAFTRSKGGRRLFGSGTAPLRRT